MTRTEALRHDTPLVVCVGLHDARTGRSISIEGAITTRPIHTSRCRWMKSIPCASVSHCFGFRVSSESVTDPRIAAAAAALCGSIEYFLQRLVCAPRGIRLTPRAVYVSRRPVQTSAVGSVTQRAPP